MKTIEEKADLYGRMKVALSIKTNGDWPKDELPMPGRLDLQQKRYDAYDLMQVFEDGATEALQSQWRSVEEELPKDGERCVIMDKDGRMRTAIYCAVNRYWEVDMPSTVYIHKATTVVAWMPIPKYEPNKAR